MILSAIVISFLAALLYGLNNQCAVNNGKKYFTLIGVAGGLVSVLISLAQGSYYSHGFDIPWWLFGLVNWLTILLAGSAAVIVCKLKNDNKKREK